MSLTWTDLQNKATRLTRDITPDTLEQIKQDMNTGYHLFNTRLSRYWSRKQQFTDVIAGQNIYQTPLDAIRVIGIVVSVSETYQIPLKEIRSEYEWRQITSYPYDSNWPAYYFVLGNDEISIWPTPSQNVENGMRYYYQQDDYDLTVDDFVSSEQVPAATCSVVNNSNIVTVSPAVANSSMIGLSFQTTSNKYITWYEVTGVTDSSTLVLKSAYTGPSAAGLNFRVGQLPIFPGQYHDSVLNYGLYLYFSGKGDEQRAQQHLALFNADVDQASEEYSSSTEGNVLTQDDAYLNSWFVTPMPPPGV